MSTQSMDYGTETPSGWVVFAGVVTFLAAIANLLYGITLLAKDDWVVITPDALIQFDLTTVGVIYLIFSALGFFVGMGIFHGDLWARVLGIVGATLNIVAQMAFLSVYPAW
ncbi:MAG: hypothetical protein ACERLM_17245, partial [Acidimicrobiales bacterium]